MKGWNGKILRVDLTEGTAIAEEYSEDFARRFVGGRGFAIKLLWDELAPGVDPLGPENMIIFATGPLTGHVIPNSGKMVVAAKSPITGGYGDGNLGSWASVNLRKAGLDAIVVKGRSEKPVYLHVENDEYSIEDASDLWGLDSYKAEAKLKERLHQLLLVHVGRGLLAAAIQNICLRARFTPTGKFLSDGNEVEPLKVSELEMLLSSMVVS
ncbi:MAG: aldehyde ferredoxin oxidoreductase N-terminal domain-containing protein [Candidatus Bathyarchaeota archaeon]|nr:aldehyde ferredoxin oxidoreductase N-terminal domain-containing protein [Candidatus Bathyarchaeota archaeon]